jgi:metallo-beta-lactamase class B
MKRLIINALLLFIITITIFRCHSQKKISFQPKEVYQSNELVIIQLAENSYQHISYKQTNDFGNVPCNGLVVKNKNEAIVFDTPTHDKAAAELIKWIKETLRCTINAVIPTHFHDDCLGGLNAFHENRIPSYANQKTIDLAKENKLPVPQNGFADSLTLYLGGETITARFPGEGHTKDNIVGYFSHDDILFGGCLIKELNASKGYLGDANLTAWPGTVDKVKKQYPGVKIVVPGHGKAGNIQLLDYTSKLFGAP